MSDPIGYGRNTSPGLRASAKRLKEALENMRYQESLGPGSTGLVDARRQLALARSGVRRQIRAQSSIGY
jgi:hypothetical protein